MSHKENQGKISVIVEWRTMDTQGPNYHPFINTMDIYFVGSITDKTIDRTVRNEFGPFVDSWEVLEDCCNEA